MSTTTAALPTTGIWVIDPSHSNVEFVVKHLVVTKVRGRFASFSGTINVADPVEQSTVDVTLDAASITTGDEQRDGHVRSDDFLNVEKFPALTFRSTGPHRREGDDWKIPGELTIRDVTKPVELNVEFLGVVTDPWGNDKAGFAGTTEIDREAFGVTWNQALETGGVMVSNTVKIELDVQLATEA